MAMKKEEKSFVCTCYRVWEEYLAPLPLFADEAKLIYLNALGCLTGARFAVAASEKATLGKARLKKAMSCNLAACHNLFLAFVCFPHPVAMKCISQAQVSTLFSQRAAPCLSYGLQSVPIDCRPGFLMAFDTAGALAYLSSFSLSLSLSVSLCWCVVVFCLGPFVLPRRIKRRNSKSYLAHQHTHCTLFVF